MERENDEQPPETVEHYTAMAAEAWSRTVEQCRKAGTVTDHDIIQQGAAVQFEVYVILTEKFGVDPVRAGALARDTIPLPDPPAAVVAYLDAVATAVRAALRAAPAEESPEARAELAALVRSLYRETSATLVRDHGASASAANEVAYLTITGALDGRALLQ